MENLIVYQKEARTTLHEAIVKLMQQTGKNMTTQQIADALNRNKWYTKKDGSEISAFQIHGRTRNYSDLFDRQGSTVILKSKYSGTSRHQNTESTELSEKLVPVAEKMIPDELALKMLMNEKNYHVAGSIDHKVPNVPGLYCIRINKPENLPEPFCTYLTQRGHNILYIGIATESLKVRMLNQELRAVGHGTFFRGIGAVLGFRPPKGSLVNKKNKRNYTFSPKDKKAIISWINENLSVFWVEFHNNFDITETRLIETYLPLINSDKNPIRLKELADLRKECRTIANTAE